MTVLNSANIFEASQLFSNGYFFQKNRNVAPQEGEVRENIDGDEEEEEQTPKQQMQTSAWIERSYKNEIPKQMHGSS